jgi:hypothetical protein
VSARQEIEAVYPLSPQQQGMLLRSLQDDRNALFVEQEVHTLHGPLEVEAFKGAWQDLIDRHHMLRTAFSWRTRSEPLQVVFRSVPVPLDVYDWRLQTPADRKQQLDEYLRRERVRGFEFSRPPLMRLALIRTSGHTHELVWTQHHILYDGWCRAVLFRELTAFFAARSSGAAPALPEAAQYGSYVEWLGRQDPSDARRFWRRQLKGFQGPRPLGRATGSNPSPGAGMNGHQEQELRCSVEDMAALDRFAQQNRVTAGVVMQGLWAVLLARYAGHSDVVMGVTVSGRPPDLPGVETIVGPFMNTLPLRVHVQDALDVCTFLKELHAHNTELRQFEYCSSAQIHEWTGIPGAVPLFDHILVYENYPGASEAGSDAMPVMAGENRFVGARTTFSLALLIIPGAGLALRAVFDPGRLGPADVRRMLEHLVMLLRQVATQPSVRLGELLVSDFDATRYRSTSEAQKPLPSIAYVAPETAIEKKVAAIAAEVLGLPRVSIAARFLELGGHSLLATQFVSRVSAGFAMEIPLSRVFDTGNLRAFAAALEQDIARKVQSLSEEEAVRMLEALDQVE